MHCLPPHARTHPLYQNTTGLSTVYGKSAIFEGILTIFAEEYTSISFRKPFRKPPWPPVYHCIKPLYLYWLYLRMRIRLLGKLNYNFNLVIFMPIKIANKFTHQL